MSKGIFTISLDFELYWGVRDHRLLQNYGSNIKNVHIVIPRLLKLFKNYGVHCSWATVGFLFYQNKEELLTDLPKIKPGYLNKDFDPYFYIDHNELDPVYHFSPELINMIMDTPGQEIGTHTFSHFYALERNTTLEQFKSDIEVSIAKAKELGIDIGSIVFPRNQYSDDHIKICQQLGIKVYRGNEESGIYQPVSREQETIYRRAIRLLDTYINITGHHCHKIPEAAEIINVPASRFLRPYSKKLKMIQKLKFNRIRDSVEYAAANGLIYQLWWHPHNFGSNIEENFSFLEKILKVYSKLNQEDKMESQNLMEIYSTSFKHHNGD